MAYSAGFENQAIRKGHGGSNPPPTADIMDNIKIIKLPVERWEEYKNLRLEALKQEPQAFSSSYEDDVLMSDEQWQSKLANYSDGKTGIILAADLNGELVGIMNSRIEQSRKMGHVAFIHGVYVKPEFRGKGIGKKLLEEILQWIEGHREIVKINLDVTTEQEAAIALYKSVGFEIVGHLKKEYLIKDKFYDVYEMEKYL